MAISIAAPIFIMAAAFQSSFYICALKQAFNGALTPMVQCLIDSLKVSTAELSELEELIKVKKRTAKDK